MAMYIDAEKLEKDGWSASRTYQQDAKTMVYETKKMTDFPTADVVEVVRCNDCKYVMKEVSYSGKVSLSCWYRNGIWTTEDYYCAKGERIIEVEPVVRCKDCKYYNRQNHYCEGIGNWFGYEGEWSDNGFCYKGERREDGRVPEN